MTAGSRAGGAASPSMQSPQRHQQQQQQQQQRQPPDPPPTGGGGRAAAVNAAAEVPRMCWDLRLHPASLEASYWRDRARTHIHWDTQVSCFLLAIMLCLTPKHITSMGWRSTAAMFGPPWLIVAAWLLALRRPAWYLPRRRAIVVGVRLGLGLLSAWSSHGIRGQLHNSMLYSSPAFAVLSKFFLVSNAGQMPIEAERLQLPILLQAGVTGFKAACLLLGSVTRELIAFCNTPAYLAALHTSTTLWTRVVQSGAGPLPLPQSPLLAGRSCAALTALLVLYSTTWALVTYMCYMSLWADVRRWLAAKAAAAASDEPDAPPGFMCIAGAMVSREQLTELARGPAATLLLDARGLAGHASATCLHVGAINVLCLACLLGSRLVGGLLLPELLPARLLDAYFPQTAAEAACAGGGVSGGSAGSNGTCAAAALLLS